MRLAAEKAKLSGTLAKKRCADEVANVSVQREASGSSRPARDEHLPHPEDGRSSGQRGEQDRGQARAAQGGAQRAPGRVEEEHEGRMDLGSIVAAGGAGELGDDARGVGLEDEVVLLHEGAVGEGKTDRRIAAGAGGAHGERQQRASGAPTRNDRPARVGRGSGASHRGSGTISPCWQPSTPWEVAQSV